MSKHKQLRLEIEKKASTFKIENGIGATEPIHLSSLLLKLNVITLFKPLSDGLAGMAIKSGEDRFMMVNQNHQVAKQHFTIGHEIYHLFVQENFSSQKCVTGLFDKQKDIEELKADVFSACLLLPEVGIMQIIPDNELGSKSGISAETLFKIQHYYGVSMRAVIYRLVELDLINKSYFDSYSTGIVHQAQMLGYNKDLYQPGNFKKNIGDYGIIANQLFKNQKISESHYFELMNAIEIDPLAPIEGDDE